jgi:tRNA(Ile)-lysidine synthase
MLFDCFDSSNYHHPMRDKVLHYIRERKLLKPGDRAAVAVSGGADSVALLRVLLELRDQLGVVLHVAHFNHQLRGEESDADERFVAELARQHELSYFSDRADVRAYAENNNLSLEHAARALRYQWLTELACSERLDSIATAHNADDQAETVLMKFLRGAGTRGLAGIYPVLEIGDVPVIRPLLQTPRLAIEHYLRDLNQPWCEDHTNLDTQHTRNRIRHELLPLLEREYNPSVRKVLNETAEIARGEEEFWQTLGFGCLQSRAHSQELTVGDLDQVQFPLAAQRRLFKNFLESNDIAANFHHIEGLRQCANGEVPSINLPGGWRARLENGLLQLILPEAIAQASKMGYECSLRIGGACSVPQTGLTLRATLIPAESAAHEPPGTLLRLGRLGRLTVRNWRPGDRFRAAYSGGEEKLKRLFAEKKIPADQRKHWPVVLNKDQQIVWVRGFPVAHEFAWTSGPLDALRIEITPCEPPSGTSSPDATSK